MMRPNFSDSYFQGVTWKMKYDLLSPVKDQLNTDSCLAFAIGECMQVHYKKKYGWDLNFSAQPYVDFYTSLPDGTPPKDFDVSMKFFMDIGLALEIDYPWGGTPSTNFTRYTISSYKVIGPEECVTVLKIIRKGRPLIGVLYLTPTILSLLKEEQKVKENNILESEDTRIAHLNPLNQQPHLPKPHAVVIIAFGLEDHDDVLQEFFLIKNSWGPDECHNGFAKIHKRDMKYFVDIEV